MSGERILVVEDDEGIRESLRYSLEEAGYSVQEAAEGASALRLARQLRPELILLDVMLPGLSGVEVLKALRKGSAVPVILVTARGEELDRVIGLELGADDYVTKPFSVRELLARVGAVLRRSRGAVVESGLPDREEAEGFLFDRAARRVLVRGAEVKLTAREFDLLSFLLGHPGRVQSREALLSGVWGPGFGGDSKTVDVHVRWLREKFAGKAPFEIVTVRGAGYRLDRR